jgi:hypothetical protein
MRKREAYDRARREYDEAAIAQDIASRSGRQSAAYRKATREYERAGRVFNAAEQEYARTSGVRHNPPLEGFRVRALGSDYLVTVDRWAVDAFRSQWPGSDLPDRSIRFRFDQQGGLVDVQGTGEYDGEDLAALSQDAWAAVGRDLTDEPGHNPPLGEVRPVGSNQTEVRHGAATILYSYSTPVAVWFPGKAPYVTLTRHSATTSKHIGAWLREHGFSAPRKVAQEFIEQLARSGEDATPREFDRSSDVPHGNPRHGKYPGIGSVSQGTMRVEDLLPIYAGVLDQYGNRAAKALAREFLAMPEEDITGEEGDGLLGEMEGSLGDLAPPYTYFGASPQDGADFGFWPDVEGAEEAVRAGDMLQVDDWSEVPRSYTGEVMHVSDHGNVTVGYMHRGGKLEEYWAMV